MFFYVICIYLCIGKKKKNNCWLLLTPKPVDWGKIVQKGDSVDGNKTFTLPIKDFFFFNLPVNLVENGWLSQQVGWSALCANKDWHNVSTFCFNSLPMNFEFKI